MEDNINFGGLPPELSMYSNSRFVILPVPYDGTSTWIKGADKGPGAIIEASMNMELYDIETDSEPCEEGIFTDAPINCDGTPDELSELVEEQVSKHLTANKLV
ncbi:agmatinase, partial [Candidatus Peregrinibacteria bacterium CG10_big_fil_rev_8_21_14_0_10_44_7]